MIPVVGKSETIKHLPSIPAGTIHGRHSSSLLTTGVLQNRIKHNLWRRFKTFLKKLEYNTTYEVSPASSEYSLHSELKKKF